MHLISWTGRHRALSIAGDVRSAQRECVVTRAHDVVCISTGWGKRVRRKNKAAVAVFAWFSFSTSSNRRTLPHKSLAIGANFRT